MRLVGFLVLLSIALSHAAVEDLKCWRMVILSKHPQTLDPAHGSHNWEAQGDYSGTHQGPTTVASLDESGGWRFDGVADPFLGTSQDMVFRLMGDVTTPYKDGSLGKEITFHEVGTSLTFDFRAGGPAPGVPEDLNHDTVSNAFTVSGMISFTVVRASDDAEYHGVFTFEDQLVAGTAFNGLGFHGQEFVDETLTIWLWGTEDPSNPSNDGYGFLKGEDGGSPLAIDLVISGDYVECDDDPTGEADDCDAVHVCDPEQCGDDCECILHTTIDCGKLNVVPGSLGACEATVPAPQNP